MINLIIVLLIASLLYLTQCTNDSTDNSINLVDKGQDDKGQDIKHEDDSDENELKRKFEDVINIMSEIEATVNSLEDKISQIKRAKPYTHTTKKYEKGQIKKLKFKVNQLKNRLYLEKLKYDKLLKKLSKRWATKPATVMNNKVNKDTVIDSKVTKDIEGIKRSKKTKKFIDIRDIKYESGDYYLQLGVFKNYKNALRLKQLMDKLEVKTTIIKKKYYSGIHYEDRSDNKNNIKEDEDAYNINSNILANWEQANIWDKEIQNNKESNNMNYIKVTPTSTIPYDKILYYVVSKYKYSFKTTLQLTKFLTQKEHSFLIRRYKK